MPKTLERRIIERPVEVRTNADGSFGVSGYASVFDSPAHGEVIRHGAFHRTLGLLPERKGEEDDVKLKVNHEGVALARTKSGTLTLSVDDIGLRFDAPSLDQANPDVQRLVSAMLRRDIDQCSFAGYFTDTPVNDGVREVREVQLTDVSIVTDPWYEDTAVVLTGNRNVDRELYQIRSMPADERDLLVAALVEPEEKSEPAPVEPESEQRDERPRLTVEEARALLTPAA